MGETNRDKPLGWHPEPGQEDTTPRGTGDSDELSEEELDETSGGLLRYGNVNPVFTPNPPPVEPVFQPMPPPIKSFPNPPPI